MATKSTQLKKALKIASKVKSKTRVKQNPPQSASYTKSGDKQVPAKAVGYRFTDRFINSATGKALGISAKSKPTASQIEKYKDKKYSDGSRYIYSEARKDKSDVSYKDRLKKGGVTQNPPQSTSYNVVNDKEKYAKPVGYRFTDRFINSATGKRLGITQGSKPTASQIEKYKNKTYSDGTRYLYMEAREDKSDKSYTRRLDYGGDLMQDDYMDNHKTQNTYLRIKPWRIFNGYTISQKYHFLHDHGFNMIANQLKDGNNIMYQELPTHVQQAFVEHTKMGQYEDGGYMADGGLARDRKFISKQKWEQTYERKKPASIYKSNWFWFENGGEMEDGGMMERYTIGEEIIGGKKHYFLYNQKNGTRKGMYKSKEEATQELNSLNRMMADGGMMAKGGSIKVKAWLVDEDERGLPKIIKFASIEEAKRNQIDEYADNPHTRPLFTSLEDLKIYLSNQYFGDADNNYDIFNRGNYGVMAQGGQTPPQSQSYSKRNDRPIMAKPVGWRFTERGANRLGVNPYRKPYASEIEQYGNKKFFNGDSYMDYETRKDKSDIKPKTGLADGGSVSYNRSWHQDHYRHNKSEDYEVPMENRKMAKGGYTYVPKEFIDSITTSNDVEFDNSEILDGAYVKGRNRKFEDGGHMDDDYAKGGRIANSDSRSYSENHLDFKGNNLEGKTLSNGDYVVRSYGWYALWYWVKKTNTWYGNATKFSASTSRQASQSRPTYDAIMLPKEALEKVMSNSSMGLDEKEMGGGVETLTK